MSRSLSARILRVTAAVGVTLAASDARAQTPPRATTTAADLSASLETTARLVGASVVEIFTMSYTPGDGVVPRSADLVTMQRASGSGVIVDPEGYIVTNAHVVAGARRLRIDLPIAATGQSILAARSRSVTGEIVGIDLETDLAVIRVDQRNLPAVAFGDSDELKAGQIVLALGSPLGFNNSVSLGVVSAVARQLEPESPMIYVQTDASIHPGSSGGALVDVRGRLVGINTLIMSKTGSYEGVGFAAPSNIVRTVYEQIRTLGRVRRGEIGIRAQTITPTLATGLNLARDHGVVLADVTPGGPAAAAGLRPGDLVLTLDDKPMENGRQLHVGIYRRAGDVASLSILREGKTLNVPVPIAERRDPFGSLSERADPRDNLVQRLGILGVTLDQRLARIVPVLRVDSGVVVVSTVAGAIDAREGGLEIGDVVFSVNRTRVSGLAELRTALDGLKTGDPVVLHLERRGALMYLAFTIE
ncbi:MAG TPA: trypsin-like peptidase domain-containing protein [Vicinamibacterales bacterium]|nr:trypsin-like peptidase domain-containing protein [Vicinamibacterales bacterium]